MNTDKTSLRKALRARRRSLDSASRSAAAHGLLRQLQSLEIFKRADKIAMYLANDGEIDPRAVMLWSQQNRKACYLPVIRQSDNRNSLVFARMQNDTPLIENRFGIPEPDVPADEMIPASDLNLVLLPLVGFDSNGHRIGMGGGFYDTTFEFVRIENRKSPALVGVAHEIQKVAKIDAERWDIPLSTVVTEEQVYQLNSSNEA
jgi:5-formyltetrahydrofolate cyclo-ligase